MPIIHAFCLNCFSLPLKKILVTQKGQKNWKSKIFSSKAKIIKFCVIIISLRCFRVSLHSIVAWMPGNSSLQTGTMLDQVVILVTATGFKPTTT